MTTYNLVSNLRLMGAHQQDDLSLCTEAADEIERLRAELETVKRRYAPSMTDLMVPPEDINKYLDNPAIAENIRLRADLAEAVDAIQPFAKAHQDVLRALVYPNWQWKLPTTDDYETAQAIVEKHK